METYNKTVVCNETIPLCWETHWEQRGYLFIHMPMAITGIMTNILNLIVLHQKPFRIKVTAFTLLRAMACADLFTCCTVLPIGLCRCLEPHEQWHTYLQQFYEVYIYLPIANWFGTVSVWLTMVVTIERYMSVAHAIVAKNLWSPSMAHWIIAALYLAGLLMNMPHFFMRQISDSPPPIYTE